MKKEQRGVNVVAGWYTNGAKWLGSRICSPKKEQNVPKERKSEKSSKRVGKNITIMNNGLIIFLQSMKIVC